MPPVRPEPRASLSRLGDAQSRWPPRRRVEGRAQRPRPIEWETGHAPLPRFPACPRQGVRGPHTAWRLPGIAGALQPAAAAFWPPPPLVAGSVFTSATTAAGPPGRRAWSARGMAAFPPPSGSWGRDGFGLLVFLISAVLREPEARRRRTLRVLCSRFAPPCVGHTGRRGTPGVRRFKFGTRHRDQLRLHRDFPETLPGP